MANDQPIYRESKICSGLFKDITSKSNAASLLVVETVSEKFKQWIRYLAVFDSQHKSLDTRLKYSETLSKMVLQYLEIVSRNLARIKELEGVQTAVQEDLAPVDSQYQIAKQQGSASTDIQKSIEKEVHMARDSQTSSVLVESLLALRRAVDGLYRLGAAIRQSSSQALNRRVLNFAQKNEDESIESLVLLQLKRDFFEKTLEDNAFKSPLSLYEQLATSTNFRYFTILYRQNRMKQAKENLDKIPEHQQAEDEVSNRVEEVAAPQKPLQGDLRKLVGANTMKKYQAQKPESTPTTVRSKDVLQQLQQYATSSKPYSATQSAYSPHVKHTKYPSAPKIDAISREAGCPFCDRPILESELAQKNWWLKHVDNDFKWYTCLSETCAEPPLFFINHQEWVQHMDERHSERWMEEIHKPLGWACDIDHEQQYFTAEELYDKHVGGSHPKYEAEIAELKSWSKFRIKRPSYTCPICNCIPDDVAVILRNPTDSTARTPEAVAQDPASRSNALRKKLLYHIGDHLVTLGLDSIRYLKDDIDGDSINSKRGSIAVDENQRPLLVEQEPGYLDPDWAVYENVDEPREPRKDEAWSAIYEFMEVVESNTERDDPLERLMAHQREPRLLEVGLDGNLEFTRFTSDNVPRYAILSHTWEMDGQEVQFRDMADVQTELADPRNKTGYKKIQFCSSQARRDGLKYIWVDTCCIDKSNYAEHEIAINSMFDWYGKATKCYVLLSDVSSKSDLSGSRWFTRGWTLLELLAPDTVEFFSHNGERLGDKKSLSQELSSITGIPPAALAGEPLQSFSISERWSWIQNRQTTRTEDLAYSLLGIFSIKMPLRYGEGQDKALERLGTEVGTQLSVPPSLGPLADMFEPEDYLADRIVGSFRLSNFHQPPQYYLPQSCLDILITPESIQEELDRFESAMSTLKPRTKNYEALQQYDHAYRSRLAEWIYANARKIFANTVYCDLEPLKLVLAMAVFRERQLTDDTLLPATGSISQNFPVQLWKNAMLHEFCRKQWRFLVPVFSPDQYYYELESECVLPFDVLDTTHNTGAFSSTYRIQIHKDHNKHENLGDVCLKEIDMKIGGAVSADRAWDSEARALNLMNTINHPHIVKCFAAIRKGDRGYLMFPWAQGSLRVFWSQHPRNMTPIMISQIIIQLRGIADALVHLHNGSDEERQKPTRDDPEIKLFISNSNTTSGPEGAAADQDHEYDTEIRASRAAMRHGNLKPENIIVFNESGAGLGQLKIGDLGLAKQHVVATSERNEKKFMRYTYEAPETVTARYGRSRLYDIWSMGCITLEFIIWILYGNDHLTHFYNQVAGGNQLPHQYYEIRRQDDKSSAEIHPIVRRWIAHIREQDPECRQDSAIRDLLRIVEEKLLVVALPVSRLSSASERWLLQHPSLGEIQKVRATAREFRDSLDAILDKKDQKNYLCTGNDRSSANPPSRVSSLAPARPTESTKVRIDQQPLLTGVRGQQTRKDYLIPPLTDWEFPVDNTFAYFILQKVGNDAFLPRTTTPSTFCARCSMLDFWIGGFSISDTLTGLEASQSRCPLCKMLYDACPDKDAPANDRVQFDRRESKLYLTGHQFPVLSLVRSPNAKLTRHFQLGFPVLPETKTDTFYDILNGWLEDCNTNHNDPKNQNTDCSGVAKQRLPTRLIDVGTIDTPYLRLVESQEEKLSLKEEYIALSHPWGDTKKYTPFRTLLNDPDGTDHEIDKFKRAIPENELPATFRDAVACTRRLKIRYLWIDSICIIQGAGGDFNAEAARMESVFSGAYCVLAASRAIDQRDGFLGPRRQRKHVTVQPDTDVPFFVCETIDDFSKDVIHGPLNKRGWVLEQRALARRTIHFTETQTYFECGYGVRCETMTRMHNNTADLLGDPRFPSKAMRTPSRALKIEYFQGLYKQYSRLHFTNYADRPLAITWLEKRLQDAFGTKGGFGIFDDGDHSFADNGLFHRSLLWKRSEEGDEKREGIQGGIESTEHWLEAIDFPPERNIAVPTWSWQAYKGAIDYTDPPYQSADWERREIISPWTQGPIQGRPCIQAIVRDFNVAGGRRGEYHLVYDLDRATMGKPRRTQCIIVARSKQPQDERLKHIYVLLVTRAEGALSDGRIVYTRAGAGVMFGKFIALDGDGIRASVV